MLRTPSRRCDIQICFNAQEHPVQTGKMVDLVLITLPLGTEMHTQPFLVLLFVKISNEIPPAMIMKMRA